MPQRVSVSKTVSTDTTVGRVQVLVRQAQAIKIDDSKLAAARNESATAILKLTGTLTTLALSYGQALRASAPAAAAMALATEQAKDLLPGPNYEIEIASLRRAEQTKIETKVAKELLAQKGASVVQAGTAAGESLIRFGDAIAVRRAEEMLPFGLRNTGNTTLQMVSLMLVSDLRQHAEASNPSTLAAEWDALIKIGVADKLQAFAYVVPDVLRKVIDRGATAIKLAAPRTAEGTATRELARAHALFGAIQSWKADQQSVDLKSASDARDILARAHKLAVGLDQTWLSRSEFSRLIANGTIVDADPDRPTYRMAPLESVLRRLVPIPAQFANVTVGPTAVKPTLRRATTR